MIHSIAVNLRKYYLGKDWDSKIEDLIFHKNLPPQMYQMPPDWKFLNIGLD